MKVRVLKLAQVIELDHVTLSIRLYLIEVFRRFNNFRIFARLQENSQRVQVPSFLIAERFFAEQQFSSLSH